MRSSQRPPARTAPLRTGGQRPMPANLSQAEPSPVRRWSLPGQPGEGRDKRAGGGPPESSGDVSDRPVLKERAGCMKYPHQASPLRICGPELDAKQPAQGPLAQIHRCSERRKRNIPPEIRLDHRASSRQTLIARIGQTDASRRGDGNEPHQQGFGLACQRSRNSRVCQFDQQGTKEPVHSEDNRSVGTGRERSRICELKSVHSAIAEHPMLMPHVSRGEHGAIRRRRPHASAGRDCNEA